MRENRITKKYLGLYTLFFLALCAAVFFPYVPAGKSLIGNGDGQSQYILQLDYMGKWLRSAVRGFLHGSFHPVRYDLTIGLGDDINAVVRFHPLDFLAVFVPEQGIELLYHVLIFLRLYLAGLTFSLYAFAWRRDADAPAGSWGVLAGSLVYLFAGYTFCLGIVHPTYLSPLVTLPLLFRGAERMLHAPERHRFVLFSAVCALSFISNYYFMFIASVAVFLYVLVRFFQVTAAPHRARRFLETFVRFVLAYGLGVLLSGITLVPALTRYSQSYRSERLASAGSLWVYADKRRYAAWLLNLISPLRASGNGTHLNFAVLALPALVLLFVCKKRKDVTKKRAQERTFLRICALVLLAFLLVPAGGYVMAALSTENNRWVFLIALLCGGAVSFSFEDLQKACAGARRPMTALLAACLLYDAAVLVSAMWMGRDLYNLAGALQLTAATALILCKGLRAGKGTAAGTGLRGACVLPAGGTRPGTTLLLGILCVSVAVNGFLTFGAPFGNLPQYYMPRGTSLSWYRNSVYASYPAAEEGVYGRSDGLFSGNTEDNAALLLKYSGVQMYNSVLNAAEIDALLSQESIGLTTMLHVTGLDGRPAAEALAGVRWFLADEANKNAVPPGYRAVGAGTREGTTLYENTHSLPLTYGTRRGMLRSEYEKLTGVQKEWALLEVSVLEDADISADGSVGTGLPDEMLTAEAWTRTCGIVQEEVPLPDGADQIEREETAEGASYRVRSKKAQLCIPYERRADCVCYVTFSGLEPSAAAKMKVKADGISRRVTLLTPSETYTLRRNDYTICLGSAQTDAADTLTLSFTAKGTYSLEGLTFSYVPLEGYEQKLDALERTGAAKLQWEGDVLTAQVQRAEAGVQVFALPCSAGWSAKVNGEEVPLLKTDLWAMGLVLPEGGSEVVLTYRTPGRAAGCTMTAAGLVFLLAAVLLFRRLRKRGNHGTMA